MTLVVPLLILGALHDALVSKVFVAKSRPTPHDQLSVAPTAGHMVRKTGFYVLVLALTLVGPFVKLLILLLAFGLLGRLGLGNVTFPILVDTVLRAAISSEQVEISVDRRKNVMRNWACEEDLPNTTGVLGSVRAAYQSERASRSIISIPCPSESCKETKSSRLHLHFP